MLNGETPSNTWKKNFRSSRPEFEEFVEMLRPAISPNPKSPNNRALSAEKKLAATLYYLKDTGTLNMTANTFGIGINTVSTVIFDVCNAISRILGPRYIFIISSFLLFPDASYKGGGLI